MFLVSFCSCLCAIYWGQVMSQEWRCSWSSACRRCSNYIAVSNNFNACWGATYINTLRPRENGRRFADDTFKRLFLNENVRISIKISLKFVPKGPINNNPALVQIMAWRRSGDKPLSEPMMVSLLTHICVTRPQWVKRFCSTCIISVITKAYSMSYDKTSLNSLWPSDAIWQHRSGSSLAEVMACCLAASSHYQSQCWLSVSIVLWHSPESNSTRSAKLLFS